MLSGLFGCVMNSDGFRLEKFPATIGRCGDATIQLDDRFSSRLHCVIEACDDGFVLTDLDSQHGTFVNGVGVSSAQLWSGDIVQIGLHVYRIHTVGKRILFRAVNPSLYPQVIVRSADVMGIASSV